MEKQGEQSLLTSHTRGYMYFLRSSCRVKKNDFTNECYSLNQHGLLQSKCRKPLPRIIKPKPSESSPLLPITMSNGSRKFVSLNSTEIKIELSEYGQEMTPIAPKTRSDVISTIVEIESFNDDNISATERNHNSALVFFYCIRNSSPLFCR